jgi:ABC-type Fe3+-siderophore transport system permease subunit
MFNESLPAAHRMRLWQRTTALGMMLVLLLLLMLCSLMIGSQTITLPTLFKALFSPCQQADCVLVTHSRLPRTLAGLLVGMALGMSGVLMQSLTANPLAEPGILGVNAGASFAVVIGMSYFPDSTLSQHWIFACAGALCASVLVSMIGAQYRGKPSPLRLILAGMALTALLDGMTSGMSLLNPQVYDQLRFWQAGSLDIGNMTLIGVILPPILIGCLLCFCLSQALNNLAMGNDLASALGTSPAKVQLTGLLAVTLLCGSATAAVGPIAFIGLIIPHIARRLAGSDLRWLFPWTLLLTPAMLLLADIIGRLLLPGEVRVSVITALLGAPWLIMLIRRHHLKREVAV